MTFWDFFWLMIWTYFLVSCLVLLFRIVVDLFRDTELSGVAKALWMIGLIVLPFVSALVYLIVRGRGMAERMADTIQRAQTDRYAQYASSHPSSTDQIASAKVLLDEGTITRVEFDGLKAKALAA